GLNIEAGLAVELNPLTFMRCLVNFQANGISSTQIVNAGIAGANGHITFNPSERSLADSIFTTRTADKNEGPQVEIMTLETLLEKHGRHFQRFDLLKIDCEQAEYSILKSVPPGVLGKFHYIIIEFHPEPKGESIGGAQAKLKESGFCLVRTLPDPSGVRFTSLFAHS
ncbi:MAG: FkbM family methyltransferase, partial [Limisphaerales bacterium]